MIKKTALFCSLAALIASAFFWSAGSAQALQARRISLPLGTIDPRTPISSLPFTIDRCGSFFLTACLTGVSGQNGITIDSDNVTIDLNGFTLRGVTGSLNGIECLAGRKNVQVHNGTVSDWNGAGLYWSGENAQIWNIRAEGNQGNGVTIDSSARSIDLSMFYAHKQANSTPGMNPFVEGVLCNALHCTISESTLTSNSGSGIHLGPNSSGTRVENCHVAGNQQAGIRVEGSNNVVVKNSAEGNASNYSVMAGNDVGPISQAATATSCWANISN